MGCGASTASNVKEKATHGAKKATEGAKVAGAAAVKGAQVAGATAAGAAGGLTRTVTEKYRRFRCPEDDPTVPELLARAVQRLRAAFTHSDPEEIRAAMDNGMRSVASGRARGAHSQRHRSPPLSHHQLLKLSRRNCVHPVRINDINHSEVIPPL